MSTPDYDKLLNARPTEELENAYEALNRAYDHPEQLLHADVSLFENLDLRVFAYFDRDDVFYVNKAGRRLLNRRLPLIEADAPKAPPIFWLDDHRSFLAADGLARTTRRALGNVRELVTLSWGKTWFEGMKFPILSLTGQPLALLFAGNEIKPSRQIRNIAERYQLTQTGVGTN